MGFKKAMNENNNKVVQGFAEHLVSLRKCLPELVSIMEEGTGFYAFVYLHEEKSQTAMVNITESSSSRLERGLVLRIVAKEKNYESATNQFNETHLKELARALRAKVIREVGDDELMNISYSPLTWQQIQEQDLALEIKQNIPKNASASDWVDFGTAYEQSPAKTDVAGLLTMSKSLKAQVEKVNESVRKKNDWPELASIGAAATQTLICEVFVDRHRNMSQNKIYSSLSASASTSTGKSSSERRGGLAGLEVAMLSAEQIEYVATQPYILENAERLKPGNYQIISSPDVTGVIAHEAFGHTQEGDTCLQGRSIAPGLRSEGTQVGNKHATIVNNPALFKSGDSDYGCNGTHFFDHEGQLAQRQVILDRGMLSEPMTDLLSSIKLKIPRTSNGKRESWLRPTLTRQSNTYFSAGDKTLNELIAMVKGKAYLAIKAHGGMEDPKGANLTAGTSYLEEIVDGKRTGKTFLGPQGGHIELSGYVPALLDGIIAKSKVDADSTKPDSGAEPENLSGGCGKFHKEIVKAGCGGPYVYWDDVTCG